MTPNRDYGQPPPGGMVYTAEQAAYLRSAANAERMAEALLAYARSMRLAPSAFCAEHCREFCADARAALHSHPALLAILEGEA